MSWKADSTLITADQTCWTADGSDNCERQVSNTTCPPMGPGFFIFFQNPCVADKVSRQPPAEYFDDTQLRIKRDDEELLLIIQLATTYKLI